MVFDLPGMAILRGLAFALYGWPCPGAGTDLAEKGVGENDWKDLEDEVQAGYIDVYLNRQI